MLKFSFPSIFIISCSVFCGSLFSDTRYLKPVLLKKKMDNSDPYFVSYLRDATLGSI
jgi:hypothetical protein